MNARLLSLVTQPDLEKRIAPRKRTLKAASIAFNDRQSVITCTMRNLSASGALLILPHVHMTPDDFEVFFDGRYRSARVVRRAGMSFWCRLDLIDAGKSVRFDDKRASVTLRRFAA